MKKTNILVFDGQTETLLTQLSNKDNKQCPFYVPISHEQLNKDFTFEFSVPADHEDNKFLIRGNLVGFYDLDGELQVFQIYKTEEVHSGDELRKTIFTEHYYFEMADDVVEDLRVVNGEASEAMTKALASSRWNVGQVDSLGLQNINFYYSTATDNIASVARRYGGELGFRFVLNGNTISQRLVDLRTRRGADTGNRFEFTRDLVSVKKTEELDGLKTALYGRGRGEELEDTGGYSRKITFADVVWRTIDGKPVDKPAGQEWVGLPSALNKFGRQNGTRHRFGIFDVDSTDPVEILEKTFQELQRISIPRVTYEMTVMTLEHLTGYDHKKVRMGDTVFVIDRELGLTIEARVIDIKRNLLNPEDTEIILGNFIEDITDYNSQLEEVKATLTDRKGVWDKANDVPEIEDVDDSSIVDIAPSVPQNISAQGLFKSIILKWTFDPSIRISAYEVYGSRVNNFTPDSSNLLFRGKTGGFVLDADTNQTWYFRIRAMNPHGKVSAFTQQFTASTLALSQPDFENLTVYDAMINSVSADKLTAGTIDANDVTIVNLDVDNVVAGRLKAQFVEIGSTTVYAQGYDPTTKATPIEVQEAEARAKTHAETKASEAETASKLYAEAQAELERLNAIAEAEGMVSEETQARIADAEAKLDEAKAHADLKKQEAIDASKAYSDTKLTEAQQYADTKKQEAIEASEAHANLKAEYERALAEAYADGLIDEEEQARLNGLKATLDESKLYADEKKQEAIQASEGLANQAEQRAKDYSKPVMKEHFDPAFDSGGEFWSAQHVGETVPSATFGAFTVSSEAEEGKTVWNLQGTRYLYSKNPIPINVNRVYRVTFRVRQTIDATSGGMNVYAGVATLDENFQVITGGAGTHRYCAVAGTTVRTADGWQVFSGLITGIGTTHSHFRAGTRFVRPMFIVGHSGGNGTAEVDFLKFEDVTEIQQLQRVIDEVDFRTTQDAIIGTVRRSSEYTQDLALKVGQDYVDENFPTYDELGNEIETLTGNIDTKITNLKVPVLFERVSQVEQKADQIDFKFSSSGGVNLLRNSVGFSGTDFWIETLDSGGSITTIQNAELQENGSGSGFVMSGGRLNQVVSTTSQFYTIAVKVKKASIGYGYLRVKYDNQIETIPFPSGTAFDYDTFEMVIEPQGRTVEVELYGTDGLIITGTMVNIGNVGLQWQHSAGEVYNTNVLMDMNGVRVMSNQYDGYTAITPQEFSGYARVNGQMTRIFTLNGDTTEMKNAKVQSQIVMSPLQIIPVRAGGFNGWAFVPED